MTPHQKALVQSTWQQVIPISETAAGLFYGKLFELDPRLRPMFKSDITEQGNKLMQMITAAVRGLDDLGKLVPAVEALGRRHVGYGVQDHHYETVGTALIWTLGQGLGDDFTEEVEKAWVTVYSILADTMKKASMAA
ncbi:MAG TPA: globin family protein [Opitutaceae bacterium]